MGKREDRIRAWSGYWASGAMHSCSGSFRLEGDGEVAAFWRGQFDGLAPGSVIVDLGTGGGGLLDVAARHDGNRDWQLIGIDQSMAPAGTTMAPSIRLLYETPMEATGLATGIADRVISQFGIDYADPRAAAAECMRLLKPRGRIAFVLHHADSAITRVGHDELQAQNYLLADDGLLAACLALLPHMALARSGVAPAAPAHAAREGFNRAMDRGQALASRSAAPDLLLQAAAGMQQALSMVSVDNLETLRTQIQAYAEAIASARVRSEEQIEAAMDEARLADFLAPFAAEGFQMQVSTLDESGHLIACAVSAMRPA